MKAQDVAFCAFDAFLTVIWWWIWYGIVSALLGEWWGFLVVLILVFLWKVYKEEKKQKVANERQSCGKADQSYT